MPNVGFSSVSIRSWYIEHSSSSHFSLFFLSRSWLFCVELSAEQYFFISLQELFRNPEKRWNIFKQGCLYFCAIAPDIGHFLLCRPHLYESDWGWIYFIYINYKCVKYIHFEGGPDCHFISQSNPSFGVCRRQNPKMRDVSSEREGWTIHLADDASATPSQNWALEVFWNFFNNKKWFFAFFLSS